MKSLRRTTLILLPLLIACGVFSPGGVPVSTPSPVPSAVRTDTPPAPPTATASPEPSATLALPEIATPQQVPSDDFHIRLHPDGGLFVGDQVSMEVIAPPDLDLEGREVVVRQGQAEISRSGFGRFGIGGRSQATLRWVWDTQGLQPGAHTLSFSIVPEGPSWTETVTLQPESALPFPEPQAAWSTAESDCCVYYYVTGTAAERDLDTLMETADREAEEAVAEIGGDFDEVITIVFLPRVLGHGGFAGGEIYISYLDRNYAGNAPAQVLHHELIHILDGRQGGELRPTLFAEGLAVYLSDGHFKPEPLLPRAAEVLDLNWYLPLAPLADDFYPSQHEISYLQAGALIEYMIDTWGREAFESFYRGIQEHPSGQHSAAINQALLSHFDLTLEELEEQFLAVLEAHPDDPELREDVRLTVRFYDTVRRYQQMFDTSAYFLTAWLPGIDDLIENGIVADTVRHPSAPENIALETILVSADADLRSGHYARAAIGVEAVNAVLDAYTARDAQPFYAHPLAADHLAITMAALEMGYTPQQIRVTEDRAVLRVNEQGVDLVELELGRGFTGWDLQ